MDKERKIVELAKELIELRYKERKMFEKFLNLYSCEFLYNKEVKERYNLLCEGLDMTLDATLEVADNEDYPLLDDKNLFYFFDELQCQISHNVRLKKKFLTPNPYTKEELKEMGCYE